MNQKSKEQRRLDRFSVPQNGRYVIKIGAICDDSKSDLRVEIDNTYFRELPPIKNVTRYNHPAAWNGAKMLGKPQINIFILDLQSGEHNLTFYSKGNVHGINYSIEQVSSLDQIDLTLNLAANKYERQPFVNLILVNLPLAVIGAKVITKWHYKDGVAGDGDDVCLFIDNDLYNDDAVNKWMWHAAPTIFLDNKHEFHGVCPNLETGIHYVEFYVDESPVISNIRLQLHPVFQGNYWLRVAAKITLDGAYKYLLGVNIPSGNSGEINNDNAHLYYKGKELKMGVNEYKSNYIAPIDKLDKKINDFKNDIFDFSGYLFGPEDNWFYYGIDTGWVWKRISENDWDWWDPANWKLVTHN